MNRKLIRGLLVLIASSPLFAVADNDDHVAVARRTFQSSAIADISKGQPFTPAAGAAFLVRSRSHLQARLMVADLIAGDAYTVWWMVFDKPSACSTHPCTPGVDFGPGHAAVFFGTGVIAAAGGKGGVVNVVFDTQAGGPPTGAVVLIPGPEIGLRAGRGFATEVHLLMIDHGVPTADFLSNPGTWAFELTHPIPPGQADVRAVAFLPIAP